MLARSQMVLSTTMTDFNFLGSFRKNRPGFLMLSQLGLAWHMPGKCVGILSHILTPAR